MLGTAVCPLSPAVTPSGTMRPQSYWRKDPGSSPAAHSQALLTVTVTVVELHGPRWASWPSAAGQGLSHQAPGANLLIGDTARDTARDHPALRRRHGGPARLSGQPAGPGGPLSSSLRKGTQDRLPPPSSHPQHPIHTGPQGPRFVPT